MPPKKNATVPSHATGQAKTARFGRQPRVIAEHIQTVDAFQESEDKFKYMFDHSSVGNSITLPSGEINVNRALCEMLGFSQDELKNCKWQEITHPEDVELTQNEMDALISGKKEMARFIKRYINKAGSVVWADVGSALRRDKDGRPLYFISTIMEITERNQAENALRLSEERLREVLENSLDASYKRDLKTNEYTYLSPIIMRLSGYTQFEMKTLPLEAVLELMHPDDQAEVRRRLAEAISGPAGAAWQVEYRFKHKEGRYCWFQDRFTVMCDPRGQAMALIGSVSDVTERKEAEEALTQKMEELERFQRLTVGRELRMIEMKREINALLAQSGLPAKYPEPIENEEIQHG